MVVITGGTDGIGYHSAQRFGREGATVFICSRKQKKVDKAVANLKKEGIEVYGKACHVGKAEDRKKFIDFIKEKKGRIDILFFNVGLSFYFGYFMK